MTAMPAVERMTAEDVLALPESESRWAELQPDLVWAQLDVALELRPEDALTSPPLPGFALALDAVFGQ